MEKKKSPEKRNDDISYNHNGMNNKDLNVDNYPMDRGVDAKAWKQTLIGSLERGAKKEMKTIRNAHLFYQNAVQSSSFFQRVKNFICLHKL